MLLSFVEASGTIYTVILAATIREISKRSSTDRVMDSVVIFFPWKPTITCGKLFRASLISQFLEKAVGLGLLHTFTKVINQITPEYNRKVTTISENG